MTRAKAPIYREDKTLPASLAKPLAELGRLVESISSELPDAVSADLCEALTELREACLAVIPITKGSMKVGFGVDATRKSVACATMTELLKQIKKAKGW